MTSAAPEGQSSNTSVDQFTPYLPPKSGCETEIPERAKFIVDEPPHHTHNFRLSALYMMFMRTGWIFKTDSIIMPAVRDVIGGAGWLRGCLPVLNRFGQSVPPLLASDHVRNTQCKKVGLFSTTLSMGICFWALALVWAITSGRKSWWLPILFLVIYGVFFSLTGINQLLLNTISGKLIRVDRRGRLALVGTVIGATTAVICAWSLLTLWLVDESASGGAQSNFVMIFAFTGTMFVAAAIVALFLREQPDSFGGDRRRGKDLLWAAVSTIKHDRNFLKVTIIAAMFGMYLTLLPHYQRLGRDRLDLGLSALIPWVLAQNIGAAIFSVPAGWIADRLGNRLVIQWMMLILCVAPILALCLARMEDVGQPWFTLVFCLLGLMPVTMRFLNNYTLEATSNSEHPRYLSTLSIAIAIPTILLSPLFGAMIDWVGFEFVFLIVVMCGFCGWLLAFTIEEPRNRVSR